MFTRKRSLKTIPEVSHYLLGLDSDSDDDDDDFIRLGLTHIMDNNLEWALSKTWLQKEDCNIFMIGEAHAPRNGKCNGTYETFVDIIRQVESRQIQVDVMLEMSQEDVEYMKDSLSPDLHKRSHMIDMRMSQLSQINMVRQLFVNCIKHKNCPIRVHWSDATQLYTNKRVPGWLHEFGKTPAVNWNGTPAISSELKTNRQLMKLLIKNGVVMKEIQKAEKVNPKFNLVFAKIFLNKIIIENKTESELKRTFNVFRTVMDIYTTARIIKLRMKNVIVYVGENHAKRIIRILESLGFNTRMKTFNRDCL